MSIESIHFIKTFRKELQTAFVKMVMGRCVELSEKGRKEYVDAGVENIGRWFFIKSIDEETRITLVSQSHHIFEGLTLSDIKL